MCPQISKCLESHLNSDKATILLVKSLGNLSANNPNNQTKLGLSGTCEILGEILKNLMPSHDVKNLLSSIKTEKTLKNSLDIDENGRDIKMNYETIIKNGNLAKWVFWTIGNLVEIGKYEIFMYLLYAMNCRFCVHLVVEDVNFSNFIVVRHFMNHLSKQGKKRKEKQTNKQKNKKTSFYCVRKRYTNTDDDSLDWISLSSPCSSMYNFANLLYLVSSNLIQVCHLILSYLLLSYIISSYLILFFLIFCQFFLT